MPAIQLLPPDTRPIALTMGEPAGIGYELTLKSWLMRHGQNLPAFVFLGDSGYLKYLADHLNLPVKIQDVDDLDAVDDVFETALPVLPLSLNDSVVPGTLNIKNAEAVTTSIEGAVTLALNNKVRAIVTNPIHKGILYDSGFAHPGHTEYLAHLCGEDAEPLMMLTAQNLRVVPLTIHIPILRVPKSITAEKIKRSVQIVCKSLQQDFGISNPRIAVAGLNPHAGEDGSIGQEEIDVIVPALDALRADGFALTGPLSADTMFHDAARETYDAALCMYHDQALIPVKTLDFYGGVNVTLNLPIIRTSPDHGTALSIAGQGVARPDSLIAAIKHADQIVKKRADFSCKIM